MISRSTSVDLIQNLVCTPVHLYDGFVKSYWRKIYWRAVDLHARCESAIDRPFTAMKGDAIYVKGGIGREMYIYSSP